MKKKNNYFMKKLVLILVAVIICTTGLSLLKSASADYPPSMISYWELDESFGITALDSCDGNDGMIFDALWTSGKVNSGLSFDGFDDCVQVPDSPSFDLSSFTIMVWAKAEGRFGAWRSILTLDRPGLSQFWFGYGANNKLDFKFNSGDRYGNTVITDQGWHFLVGVYDGTSISLYIDGVPDNTPVSNTPMASGDGTLNMARTRFYGSYPFEGVLDEVAIFNNALSSSEIMNLYNKGAAGQHYYIFPIADANGPYTGYVGETITLDGSGSHDMDGSIVSYNWDLDNDGSYDDASGATPTHSWITPGTHPISLKVTDNDGATGFDDTTVNIKVDDTSPITTKTIGWPQYMGGDYVTTWTPITLSATDNPGGSGVKEIHYIINSVEHIIFGDTVTFYFTEECTHVLEYWAVDNAGNTEKHHIQIHYVDDTPPTTYIEHIGHGYYMDPSSGKEYIKCGYEITLYAIDGGICQSGVMEIWYNFGSGWYISPGDTVTFTMPDEECMHLIQYFAVDNLGNVEILKEKMFYIDCTPPTITKTHPDPCYYPINQTAGIIKVGDRIILETVDGGTPPCISGVENTFWRYEYEGTSYPIPNEPGAIDGITLGILYGYTDPNILDYWWYLEDDYVEITFNEICKHTLYYWAKDNVCNRGPIHKQIYWVNDCQEEVWIDDDFKFSTPGWWHTHFMKKQMALDWLGPYGTAYVFDGIYDEDISIDDVPCCDNTGITQMGEYGCFPLTESAVIKGTETIKVDDVKIKYLEYTPNTNGAIIVEPNIDGTYLRCNKFRKDCVANAVGVNALEGSIVNARLNWWGAPDGPKGGIMDDGILANGNGVKIYGDVFVEPWIGIHAEMGEPCPPDPLNPDNPRSVEVEVGTPVNFDATGSWAYTYGECCQEPEELPLQYLWDFDDGTQSSNKITKHVFEQAGTYYVSLMVDSPGIPGLYANFMYDWDYVTVHVITQQTSLTCNADGGNLGGYETIVDEPLHLYGIASGGTQPYTYEWDLGDGTIINEQNPVHVYITEGIYTATLTVKDSVGTTASDTVEVIVYSSDEIIVSIDAASKGIAGYDIFFNSIVHGGIEPYTYSWDFGDGTPINHETNPVHIFKNPGIYNITLTVNDNIGKTDNAITSIAIKKESVSAKINQVTGGFGIKATIAAGDNDCYWNIKVKANFMILGGETNGIIEANTEKTVKLPLTITLGKVEITVMADDVQKQYTGFALGPLFLILQEI